MKTTTFPPPTSWRRRLSIEDAEAELQRRSVEYNAQVSPAWLARWEALKAQIVAGDELWYFESFPSSMTGGAGYCLVRDSKCVAALATMRS